MCFLDEVKKLQQLKSENIRDSRIKPADDVQSLCFCLSAATLTNLLQSESEPILLLGKAAGSQTGSR